MADFEAGMRTIVIEHSDEFTAIANRLLGEDDEIVLHRDYEQKDDRERYSVEVIRQYLAKTRIPQYMSLEAFDALLHTSENIKGKPLEIIRVATLKKIVRAQAKNLTEAVENTGEFPVTGSLLAALMEVGYVLPDKSGSDYRDLIYRTKTDRPWLRTPAKFMEESAHMDRVRNEFLSYCRIVTGR
jgi:hypothetical protein